MQKRGGRHVEGFARDSATMESSSTPSEQTVRCNIRKMKKEEMGQQLSRSDCVITSFSRQPKQEFSNVKFVDLKAEDTDGDISDSDISVTSHGTGSVSTGDRSPMSRHPQREIILHPVEIERLIPEYSGMDGSSSSRWIGKIVNYARLYGWSRRSCLHYAHSRLVGTARKWFDAQDEATLDWESFVTSLCEAFPNQLNEADIHFKLAKRIRAKDEDVISFVYDLQKIAREGYLSDVAVIAYVIRNINDERLQEYLITKDLDRIPDLICCVQRYLRLRMLTGTKQFRAEASRPQPTLSDKEKSSTGDEDHQTQGRRCYNCNLKGHLSVNCPQPQRKLRCDKCGRLGHVSADCWSGRSPRATKEQVRFIRDDDRHESSENQDLFYLDVNEESRRPATVMFDDRCNTMDVLVDLGSSIGTIEVDSSRMAEL
nr:uncharacterized protein LOC109402896 isoform X1 [Aedes albopictus]